MGRLRTVAPIEKAAAERRGGKGAKGSQDHAYDVSIEHAHWSFEHSVGVVDFEAREIWMEDARWSDAAWASGTVRITD
jgi:hypothetical protein